MTKRIAKYKGNRVLHKGFGIKVTAKVKDIPKGKKKNETLKFKIAMKIENTVHHREYTEHSIHSNKILKN